jgi:hypothetical protein
VAEYDKTAAKKEELASFASFGTGGGNGGVRGGHAPHLSQFARLLRFDFFCGRSANYGVDCYSEDVGFVGKKIVPESLERDNILQRQPLSWQRSPKAIDDNEIAPAPFATEVVHNPAVYLLVLMSNCPHDLQYNEVEHHSPH